MIRKMVACMVALLLAGCGAAASGNDAGQSTTSSPETSADGHTAEVLATLTQSGGIAGRMEVLTVHADGTIMLDAGGTTTSATAGQAALDALKQTMAGAEWQALGEHYGKPLPDAFEYLVEAGGKRIQTYDAADNPPVLAEVLDQLVRLKQSVP